MSAGDSTSSLSSLVLDDCRCVFCVGRLRMADGLRSDESRVGMAPEARLRTLVAGLMPSSVKFGPTDNDVVSMGGRRGLPSLDIGGSSLIAVSANTFSTSRRGTTGLSLLALRFMPSAPVLFLSCSRSRSCSLELMYIKPLELRDCDCDCFLPQLSLDEILPSSYGDAALGSTDGVPILLKSSFEASEELRDPGLEDRLRNDLKGLESRGDLVAVSGEKPEGGLAVRIDGGGAARSSRDSCGHKGS